VAKFRGNNQSPLAVGWMWASRITNVSLTVIVPAGVGWWCDKNWGTGPWLVILGAVVGFAVGAISLRQLVQDLERADREDTDQSDQKRE
jgi:F0F1-type ATP synthase assembly protein I